MQYSCNFRQLGILKLRFEALFDLCWCSIPLSDGNLLSVHFETGPEGPELEG
jgi:hypothetical protein